MAEESNPPSWRVIVGTVITFVFTGQASIIGWLVVSMEDLRHLHTETDRTQEAVLQRLNSLESQQAMMDAHIRLLPDSIDDDDRWTESEELQFQRYVNHRLEKLEDAHKSHSHHRGYIDIR